ncbi:MAG: hypothetical protein GY761_03180 [Hyphomicrobiales bacterium]|nr:hypothetical protein [Hyphomicrobiales bacterium]
MSKITDEFSGEVEKDIVAIEDAIKQLGYDISALNSKLSENGSDALKYRHFTAAALSAGDVFSTYGNLASAVAAWHKMLEKFDSREPQARIGGGGK